MKNRSLLSCLYGASLRCSASIAAVALLALGNSSSYAAPGNLDTTFNGTGFVSTDYSGGSWDSATGMAVYGVGAYAGRIVVVGYTDPTGNGGDVIVTRYLADGTLDASFGTGGHVVIDVGGAGNADSANAVALDSDTGSVFVAGFTSNTPDYYDDTNYLDSLLIKLDAAGVPDATFGVANPGLVSDGVIKTVLSVASNDEFRGIALQSNGKVVVCGQALDDGTNDMTVVRYLTDGTLDTSFAYQGVLFANVTVEDFAEDLVIKEGALIGDLRIIVVGETHGLETTKGPATDMAMIQIKNDGSFDTAFGKAGKVVLSFTTGYDRAESVALQPDGMIVVAGRSTVPNAAVLARFTTKGALDTKFGTKGITSTPLSAPPDDVNNFSFGSGGLFGSLALTYPTTPNYKIYFSAYELVGNKTNAVLLRFNSDGKTDTAFGINGKVQTEVGEYADAVQIAWLEDGHILAAGTTVDALDDANLLLTRYDGSVVVSITNAASITNTSAELRGTVDGDGSPTDVIFEWGVSATKLDNKLSAGSVSGTGTTNVSATLNYLIPGTKIYYRVTAGGVSSAVVSFVVDKTGTLTVPTVKTLAATAITASSATLNGTVAAKNTTTDAGFQWGTTTSYGSEGAAPQNPLSGLGPVPVDSGVTVTGLLPHTKYNFRVRASNSTSTANGANLTFTTLDTNPVANDDAASVVPLAAVTIPVLANDTDADGDKLSVLSYSAVNPPAAGKVSKAKTGELIFTATSAFTGSATFTYIATDGFKGNSTPATVTVTADSVTATPSAQTVNAEGGQVVVHINASAGVPWLAAKNATWFAFLPTTSVVGSGDLVLVVQANKGASRSGAILIGGSIVYTITQNAGPGPIIAASTFSGLVDPDSALNGNVGGSLTLAATTSGAASGKLVLGATSYALKGFLTDADAGAVNDRQFVAYVTRKAPLAPLRLQLTYIAGSDSLGFGSGDGLTVGGLGVPVKVRGYLHTFSKTAPTANAPAGYAASYTMALATTTAPEHGVPDGDSYATIKLLNTGAATWAGKLADGTAVTGSATVWPTGELNIFKALYKNLGSIQGAVALTQNGANRITIGDSTDFPMNWLKPRNGQPAYPGAFGLEVMTVDGAEWKTPVGNEVVIGLDPLTDNAKISFDRGKIEQVAYFADAFIADPGPDLNQIFTISTALLKNKVSPYLTPLARNPAQVKITKLDVVKGTFTGTMTLLDNSLITLGKVLAGTPTKRITAFEGVLINNVLVSGKGRGAGFGLLQTLPDSSDETTTKTPKLSFRVAIAAH